MHGSVNLAKSNDFLTEYLSENSPEYLKAKTPAGVLESALKTQNSKFKIDI
jgi:hypothetical protein